MKATPRLSATTATITTGKLFSDNETAQRQPSQLRTANHHIIQYALSLASL